MWLTLATAVPAAGSAAAVAAAAAAGINKLPLPLIQDIAQEKTAAERMRLTFQLLNGNNDIPGPVIMLERSMNSPVCAIRVGQGQGQSHGQGPGPEQGEGAGETGYLRARPEVLQDVLHLALLQAFSISHPQLGAKCKATLHLGGLLLATVDLRPGNGLVTGEKAGHVLRNPSVVRMLRLMTEDTALL